MRILLIQPCFVNFGGYFRSIGISKALAKRNHQVDLLISAKENSLTIKKTLLMKNLQVFELPRINFHQFINGKILRGILGCLFIIFGRYDVIHIFESVHFETLIPLFCCKILRRPVILDIDEEWLESPIAKMNKLMEAYIRFCDLKLAPKFNFLTVTSEYLVKKFKKLGAKHVFKIINGVDLEQFKIINKRKARRHLKISPKTKMILSFGNTYEGERAYLLLKTFQEILKLDKEVRLYFNLPLKNFLKKPKTKKEIKQSTVRKIIITGYLDKRSLPYYLGACDLILFLMGNSNSEKACFPVRIGTYLTGGKVIAINQIETEVYNCLSGYNCILTGKNPSMIAQQIIKFFKDKQLRERLEKMVLKARKKMSWDYLIDGLIKFYQLSINEK